MIALATAFMGSVSVIGSLIDRELRFSDQCAHLWARMLLALGFTKVRARGLERIPKNGCCVFVGNHLSLLDTPVVIAYVPRRIRFLVNARYVKIPFLGTHLRCTGHFSVEPTNIRASLKNMSDAAHTITKKNLSVLLFPEGSRTRGEVQEFKEGAAYIAIKAGAPIVPFALWGTRELLPIGSLGVRGGTVDLVFGEPISTEHLTIRDRERLTHHMRENVLSLLSTIRPGSDQKPI